MDLILISNLIVVETSTLFATSEREGLDSLYTRRLQEGWGWCWRAGGRWGFRIPMQRVTVSPLVLPVAVAQQTDDYHWYHSDDRESDARVNAQLGLSLGGFLKFSDNNLWKHHTNRRYKVGRENQDNILLNKNNYFVFIFWEWKCLKYIFSEYLQPKPLIGSSFEYIIR